MDAKQWARYSALLDQALELPAGERDAWLQKLRNEDPAAADEVAVLLRSAVDKGADASASPGSSETFVRWYADAAHNSGSTRQPGQQFGPWRLQRPLGAGGMGEVWLSARTDGLYEGQAALKFIRAGLAPEQFAARFARERAALARLNHPGIARLLDAGVTEGSPWLVLEYVEGMPLLAWAESQRLTVAARVQLLIAAAEAVEYAHGRLVVHRDLKPSNLLVTPQGQVKLLDFGIAGLLDGSDEAGDHQLTRLTGAPLTPGYAAPEQIAGEPSSVAADVFALGVLLFQLLTGARPFAPGQTGRAAIEYAVLHEPPLALTRALAGSDGSHPPDAASAVALAPVLDKALQKRPEDRYASAAALLDDLQRWLEHRPLKAAPAAWPTRTRLWLRRNRLLAVAAGVTAAALLIGLGVALWQRQQALGQAQRSEKLVTYFSDLLGSANPDQHQGEWPTVLKLLEQAARDVPERFADDPRARKRLLESMMLVYTNLTRWEEAAAMAQQVVTLTAQLDGRDSVAYGHALWQLAELENVLPKYESALAHARESLQILQAKLPPDNDELRRARFQIAIAQGSLGHYDEAEAEYRKVVELTRRNHPDNIGEQVTVENELAVFYSYRRDLRKVLDVYRELEPRLDQLPKDRLRTALQIRVNIAAIQIRLSEYDGVEALLQKTLAQADQLFGPDNNMSTSIHTHLVNYYGTIGRYDRAAEEARLRYEQNLKRFGPDKVPVVQAQLDVLKFDWLLGLPRAQAVPRLRELEALAARTVTEPNYIRMDLHELIAGLAQEMDADDIAERNRLAHAADAGTAGIGRPDSPVDAAKLASAPLIAAGKYEEVLAGYQASARYFESSGEGATRTHASFRARYAYLLALMRSPDAAEQLRQARANLPSQLPKEHPLYALIAYVDALIAAGSSAAEAPVRSAFGAVNRAYHRPADDSISEPIVSFWF